MMSPSTSCSKLVILTVAAVVLQLFGLSLFVAGFFPLNPALPGVSGPESYQKPECNATATSVDKDVTPEQLRSLYQEMSGIPPVFDRLILMVVDGLPAEFILGRGLVKPTKAMMDNMPYTQYLLSSGDAIGYHAKAAPPTVTMPRLKAIVSGAVGVFLDVAFNLNTQAFLDDNLLGQLYHIGWRMVMFGDETWIKLFPGIFSRQDGVTSFFVKDTVEVDLNVSRHLESELIADDWNLLILHYLGLDHVGHIGGRQCELMAPKLQEMDEVIKKIHTSLNLGQSIENNHTLLIVVSDHGMTEAGNHGGSSYEETDSLVLFIGLGDLVQGLASASHHTAFQVDITPTLALLFGVPIPKNNVGILLSELFDFLPDKQRLRALELNAWQLLRLVQAQFPGMMCERSKQVGILSDKTAEKLCLLYSKAVHSHVIWKSLNNSRTETTGYFNDTVNAYREFLKFTSEFLSHRASDKQISLLTFGIGFMLVSTCLLLDILFCLFKRVELIQHGKPVERGCHFYSLNLDEKFIMVGIILHLCSFTASSMVEEEQYVWHFLASTLYLIILFMKVYNILVQGEPCSGRESEIEKIISSHSYENGLKFSPIPQGCFHQYHICFILIVLVSGRILRGWHQGGVNWTYLPDISKWLEKAGSSYVKSFQMTSLFTVTMLSSFTLYLLRSRIFFVIVLLTSQCVSGLLVSLCVINKEGLNYSENSVLKIFYKILLVIVVVVLASPWFINMYNQKYSRTAKAGLRFSIKSQSKQFVLLAAQDCFFLIGVAFTVSWCFLQLLLQPPLNALPISLLLIQLLASFTYFRANGSYSKQWVEVAAMYFLGMAGHFSLGNSNSIATIDVAGAYKGLSGHSTFFVGILMFMITYASSLLFFFGTIMNLLVTDTRQSPDLQASESGFCLQISIGFRCLIPLVLNSVALTSFTIILLIMRNHLFIWSVFSPKYLYICAATVSVYIGVSIIAATGFYIYLVLAYRTRRASSKIPNS